jgi:8-oxo-dGTP pyrophosphatase MutT (NUDIX family)
MVMISDERVLQVNDDEPPLKLSNTRIVFEEQGGAHFTVKEIQGYTRSTNDPITFHVASVKEARTGIVCVVVLRGERPENNQYLLARHWRVSTGEWGWEFPRGMGEVGETPVDTTKREMKEETGIDINSNEIRSLQVIHADTGILDDNISISYIEIQQPERMSAFRVASRCSAHDWELTQFRWVQRDSLKAAIASGEITDGITLAALAVTFSSVN